MRTHCGSALKCLANASGRICEAAKSGLTWRLRTLALETTTAPPQRCFLLVGGKAVGPAGACPTAHNKEPAERSAGEVGDVRFTRRVIRQRRTSAGHGTRRTGCPGPWRCRCRSDAD